MMMGWDHNVHSMCTEIFDPVSNAQTTLKKNQVSRVLLAIHKQSAIQFKD